MQAAKKPLLMKAMKMRLTFAKWYLHWRKETGPVSCSVMSQCSVIQAPRRRSNAWETLTVMTHVSLPRQWSIILGRWCGAVTMGKEGVEAYIFFQRTPQWRQQYIGVLKRHLLPIIHIHCVNMLMCDNPLCHQSKKVVKLLADNNILMLEWPENSPDHTLIENCWVVLKRRLRTKDTSSIPKIVDAIKCMGGGNG